MKYSKQKVFCNACGKEMFIEYHKLIGRFCKVCSVECNRIFELRDVKSNMGSEDDS